MSLNIKMTHSDIQFIETALMNCWYAMYMDAGDYNASEKAELVIDRIKGEAGEEIDQLINTFGYDAVHAEVTKLF